ncbi:MAG: Hpt domain-containing protein [Planctomycetes bacterium]|nr:Hpt domain-containing protein [Planctomycetota bacterium]
MSLRRKTLVFVIGSLALLVGAILLAVETFVHRGFESVEQERMQARVAGVQSVFATMVEEHVGRFTDWSQWDDCAVFLQDGNQGWIDSNLTPESVANLGVDVVSVVRADGFRPFDAQIDRETLTLHAPGADYQALLTRNDLLRGIDEHGPAFGGVIELGDEHYIVSSRPILMTDGTPPSTPGRLVIAKQIDRAWIERLEHFTSLKIDFEHAHELPDDALTTRAVQALRAGRTTFVCIEHGEQPIQHGYAWIEDLAKQPELLIHVVEPSGTHADIARVMGSVGTALSICGIAVALLALVGVRKAVIGPLDRLVRGVRDLEAGRRSTVSLDSGDELQALAESFNRMAVTIGEREDALLDAHQQMGQLLDNLRQGVLAFDADGRVVGETSRRAREIFGRESLVGVSIVELLYGDREEWDLERAAFSEWPALACGSAPQRWPEIVSAAPSALVLREGTNDERHLSLEFQPIEVGGAVGRVLLLVSDETLKVRLLEAQRQSESEHARALESMRRRLSGGPYLYAQFLRQSRERLERIDAQLHDDAAECFRLAHTLKGEARLFDLEALETTAHDIEELLAELRDGRRTGDASAPLRELLARARDELDAARSALVEASPIGDAVLDQVPVRRDDIERLAELVLDMSDELDSDSLHNLQRIADRLAARPFGELTSALAEQAPSWAAHDGKHVVVDVSGREVAIKPGLAEVLVGALTHLLRNCVAHGIETGEQREAHGKDPLGRIHVRAHQTADGTVIEVEDDGRGIDVDLIRRRAQELELRLESGRELEVLFSDRFSTAAQVDELSGRGVGLGAVRSDLARWGYGVRVQSELGAGTRFVLEPLGAAHDEHVRHAEPAGA